MVVDEARRHHPPGGVDHSTGFGGVDPLTGDGHDPVPRDGHVGGETVTTRSVDDDSSLDEDVVRLGGRAPRGGPEYDGQRGGAEEDAEHVNPLVRER